MIKIALTVSKALPDSENSSSDLLVKRQDGSVREVRGPVFEFSFYIEGSTVGDVWRVSEVSTTGFCSPVRSGFPRSDPCTSLQISFDFVG